MADENPISTGGQDNGNLQSEPAETQVEVYQKPVPRENLVATAINFLQNPKVKSSPLSQKRAFLLKKGLTNEEIDLAIEKTEVLNLEQHAVKNVVVQQGPVAPLPVQYSFFRRVQRLSTSFVIIGLASYGLYKIYKRYLKPWLYGEKPKEDKIYKIEQHLIELCQSLTQLQASVKSVENTLIQHEQFNKLKESQVAALDSVVMDSIAIAEMKNEIASIKSLLLSRKQFPATPVPNPCIPSWQMISHSETEEASAAGEDTAEDSMVTPSESLGSIKLSIQDDSVEDSSGSTVVLNGDSDHCEESNQ